MIKGFQDITFELTQDELKKVPSIIKGLSNKKGKANAITGAKICEAMNLSGARLRKIISYIRVNDLILGLCSSQCGYYIADNINEIGNATWRKTLNNLIYLYKTKGTENSINLRQRIATQVKVLNSLEKQTIMFGGSGQTSLFE